MPPEPPSELAMRREAALEFLNRRIDYERMVSIEHYTRQFKLENMQELLRRVGRPDRRFPIVHVAGTKGKGSTSALVGAALGAAGCRVGLFTSPHLDRIEERMAVDGQPCPAGEFVELVDLLVPVAREMDSEAAQAGGEAIGPTYFELTTAMALMHFARREVDFAVLEVGLGGRLDSTNVCRPAVCVITSISLDHTEQLGDTLEAIAREKAGIIKPGVPVVSGVTLPGPRDVIRETSRRAAAPLFERGVQFDAVYHPAHRLDAESGQIDAAADLFYHDDRLAWDYSGVRVGLLGAHQAANAATALAALAQLYKAGFRVPEEAVRRGFASLRWPARVELLARRPAVVLDAAHNVASVEALVRTLDESFAPRRRILVFGTTQEKDVAGMLACLLPAFDHIILTRYGDSPRAVPLERLAELAAAASATRPVREAVVCEAMPTPRAAWNRAAELAHGDDLICITGSFYLAHQMRQEIAARPVGRPVAVEQASHER